MRGDGGCSVTSCGWLGERGKEAAVMIDVLAKQKSGEGRDR